MVDTGTGLRPLLCLSRYGVFLDISPSVVRDPGVV